MSHTKKEFVFCLISFFYVSLQRSNNEQKKFAVRFCPRWMGADIFKAKGRYKVDTKIESRKYMKCVKYCKSKRYEYCCWWGINYLPSAQGSSVHTYSTN